MMTVSISGGIYAPGRLAPNNSCCPLEATSLDAGLGLRLRMMYKSRNVEHLLPFGFPCLQDRCDPASTDFNKAKDILGRLHDCSQFSPFPACTPFVT